MVALYGAVVAFIALVFDYINHAFPNPITQGYYYNNTSSISYETASLIVLTPVTLILMRLIRRNIAKDPTRKNIWVRRWALFLTLFIAGATFVIDLIVLLNAYLQGEDLTVGFLLKVLTVLLVASLGFMHFIADVWGYWDREPQRARIVNGAVGVLVLLTIIAGFFIVGSPQRVRAQKQDMVRVQNLQEIQWQIVNYWQQKEKLPAALADLNDPIRDFQPYVDPQSRESYEYHVTGSLSFQLCAVFAAEAEGTLRGNTPAPTVMSDGGKSVSDNWEHGVGRTCFERTIDPQFYPPYNKTITAPVPIR